MHLDCDFTSKYTLVSTLYFVVAMDEELTYDLDEELTYDPEGMVVGSDPQIFLNFTRKKKPELQDIPMIDDSTINKLSNATFPCSEEGRINVGNTQALAEVFVFLATQNGDDNESTCNAFMRFLAANGVSDKQQLLRVTTAFAMKAASYIPGVFDSEGYATQVEATLEGYF